MALHITFYHRDPNGKSTGALEERRFEGQSEAMVYVSDLWHRNDFNGQDKAIAFQVIKAAKTEYVGEELEIRTSSGKYGDFGLEIEGQFNKKTFDERYKDIIVEEIVR